MEKQKNFNKFKEFIGLFDISIKNNDFQQLNRFIPLIEDFEEHFLSGYHKRKKEGTFYTDKTISDFIVYELLLCLINKKLKNHDQNLKKIEFIDEIYKFESSIKNKIVELLLNIKICDPACGSGGFLYSSADIVLKIIRKLDPNLTIHNIKIHILKNLFGYDINEYAIKLCKLKLISWYNYKLNPSEKKLLSILTENVRIQNSIINSSLPKFDIIIGNPPYGNILNQKEKSILKKEGIFYKDIYCVFLIKALEWVTEIVGFLVPKSFLLRQGYINFRSELLSKANILKIFDIGSKMFKSATNEVQIVLYENKNGNKNRDLTIYNYPTTRIITYPNQRVDSLRICFNSNCPLSLNSKKIYVYTFLKNCPFCESDTIDLHRIRIKPDLKIFQLIEKIEKVGDINYLNPIGFPKMIRGEEENGLKFVKRKLRKDSKGSCFFISARNDFNYYTFKKYKSFNIEEINSKYLKGSNYEYYKRPKLLIKHNNIIPEALYTEDNVCFTSSIYSLLHSDIDELKYLCAILNSILIQFYCIYAINNQKDTTINLNQYMIRHLPIVKPNNKIRIQITEKVDFVSQILKDTNGKINEQISQTLRDIDDIILNLFSITETEKRLIISKVKNQLKQFEIIYGK
ncbi:MAG: Eco57I restriction-modification methylase domain-containing protein [Candidatus Lokiarchaeota archaeon]|nr:Eco57I restriction-modification methylase domain-containing protein [Candidatus Lokiarchaeota archaeon]